jgi:hypothetical protein
MHHITEGRWNTTLGGNTTPTVQDPAAQKCGNQRAQPGGATQYTVVDSYATAAVCAVEPGQSRGERR